MPRPREGYRNAAGLLVPGTHDITGAYASGSRALMIWAFNQGKAGLSLKSASEADIGTAVHAMAELDLKGHSVEEIEACLQEHLDDDEQLTKARSAYDAFCQWRNEHTVVSIAHEIPLVSETWQFAGTPDCIARIDGGTGLLDFKTCRTAPKRPYDEQLLVLSAHAALWNEHHPGRKIESHHLIYLPKDGTAPVAFAFTDLSAQWAEFTHLLHAYSIKNGTPRPADPHSVKITTAEFIAAPTA